MKIAILSDIHGNSDALKAVLKIASVEKVSQLLILGDCVGYYYKPDEVLKLLASWNYTMIRGNHEVILEQMLSGTINADFVRQKYGSGHEIALNVLSPNQLKILTTAATFKELLIEGIKIGMYHGAPWDPDQYLYPNSSKELLDRCAHNSNDFVFVGHSHYAFAYTTPHCIVINAGSVGQSRQMGGVASWVVLNTDNRSFEMRNTPYNTGDLLSMTKSIDPAVTYLSEILTRNRFEYGT